MQLNTDRSVDSPLVAEQPHVYPQIPPQQRNPYQGQPPNQGYQNYPANQGYYQAPPNIAQGQPYYPQQQPYTQQAQYYPQQPQNRPQQVIIIAQANYVYDVCTCQFCGYQGAPVISYSPAAITFIWCLILFWFTFCLFWIPFCINSCQDMQATCPSCQRIIMRRPATIF